MPDVEQLFLNQDIDKEGETSDGGESLIIYDSDEKTDETNLSFASIEKGKHDDSANNKKTEDSLILISNSDEIKQVGVKDTSDRCLSKSLSNMHSDLQKTLSFSPISYQTIELDDIELAFTNGLGTAPPPHIEAPTTEVQSYTLVKERTSTISNIVTVTSNIIIVNSESIAVRKSKEISPQDWAVEDGFQISKLVKRFSYSPDESKEPVYNVELSNLSVSLDAKDAMQHDCCEFLSPISRARLITDNALKLAKIDHDTLISKYGDPDRWSYCSSSFYENIEREWPKIQDFTPEKGQDALADYILKENSFMEDWKYSISFKEALKDHVSDLYYYEAKFSLPSTLYPVPQVTATVFVLIEASRAIPPECPVKVTFRPEMSGRDVKPQDFLLDDRTLLRILTTKLKSFKRVRF